MKANNSTCLFRGLGTCSLVILTHVVMGCENVQPRPGKAEGSSERYVDSDVLLEDIAGIETRMTVSDFIKKLNVGKDADDNADLLENIEFTGSEFMENSYRLRGRNIKFTTQREYDRNAFEVFFSEKILEDSVTSFSYSYRGSHYLYLLEENNYVKTPRQ
jgi:hypothetical protein